MPALLRAAKACGLDYAVESDVVIKESDFTKANGVENLMKQIQPGMVVSIRLDHPVPIIFYQRADVAVPAVDKKPTIKDDFVVDSTRVPVVEAVKKLCEILHSQGYSVETVDKLPAYDFPTDIQ